VELTVNTKYNLGNHNTKTTATTARLVVFVSIIISSIVLVNTAINDFPAQYFVKPYTLAPHERLSLLNILCGFKCRQHATNHIKLPTGSLSGLGLNDVNGHRKGGFPSISASLFPVEDEDRG
jgi:hypothetical protein